MASERIVKITDEGELRLYEAKENGHSYVAFKANPSIVSSYTLALPAGQGVDGEVLTADGAGGTRWGNSDATLNTAYHTGAQISADSGQIEILKTDDTNGVTIDKSATGAGVCLQVLNAGSGKGLYVEQGGNGVAVDIYQGNSNTCLNVNKQDTGSGTALAITNLGTGAGVAISQTGVASALAVTQNTAATSVSVTQSGAGTALLVDQNNAGAQYGVRVENAGTGAAVSVEQQGAGMAMAVTQQGAATGVYIAKTNVGAGVPLQVENAGSGVAVSVSQGSSGSYGISVSQAGAANAIRANKTNVGAGNCVDVLNAGTGDALAVTQTGSSRAVFIDQQTANTGLGITKAAGAGAAILIDNSGSGNDVTGTSGAWSVTPTGGATFAAMSATGIGGITCQGLGTLYGLRLYPGSKTIDTGGAITVGATDCFIRVDTFASAATDDLDTISGGQDGQILVIASVADTRTPSVTQSGNCELSTAPRALSNRADRLVLQYDSGISAWCEISFSNNS